MDTNERVDYNLRYNSKALFEAWHTNLVDNGLVYLNKEFTRYAPHQPPSIIDHIVTNRPAKISQIQTKPTMIADHCALIFHYYTKPQPPKPKFKFTRNFNLLSPETLIKAVKNNHKRQTKYEFHGVTRCIRCAKRGGKFVK